MSIRTGTVQRAEFQYLFQPSLAIVLKGCWLQNKKVCSLCGKNVIYYHLGVTHNGRRLPPSSTGERR